MRRWLVRLLILFVFLGVVGVIAGPHAYAWYHLRAGREAEEHYQTEKARDHLRRCLSVWKRNDEAHLLAARCARRAADFDDAIEHLHACQNLRDGGDDETALEWAMIRASMGDLDRIEVEQFLVKQSRQGDRNAPLIWEALAEGYIRMYRVLDALAVVNVWLQADTDNLRALMLRGHVHWQVNAMLKAVPDYRKVVERDPDQDDIRWRLSLCLLETGQYSEALKHLEEMYKRRPDDRDVKVRLARCQYLVGQRAQARSLLAKVLAVDPEHGPALRARGQMNLMDGSLEEAETDLREAVRLMPFDHASHWSLHQTLQRLKKHDEAKAMGARAEKLKEGMEKLQQLSTQKMSVRPNDPDLHCEMGKLLLSQGYKEVGVSWLESALEHKPDHRGAHAALAEYYAAEGKSQKAEEHRRLAAEK